MYRTSADAHRMNVRTMDVDLLRFSDGTEMRTAGESSSAPSTDPSVDLGTLVGPVYRDTVQNTQGTSTFYENTTEVIIENHAVSEIVSVPSEPMTFEEYSGFFSDRPWLTAPSNLWSKVTRTVNNTEYWDVTWIGARRSTARIRLFFPTN
jgi:hypothetical protein